MTNFSGSGISQAEATAIGNAFIVSTTPQGLNYAAKYIGEPGIPKQVARRRRWVYDAFRRVGTPFLWKHKYSQIDVDLGIAQNSPAFSDIYGRSGRFDTISHGVSFVSQVASPNEWYDTEGNIEQFTTNPGAGWTPAPLYRGYGPGWIVYCIQPDSPLDYLKVDPSGSVMRVMQPQILCPWFPIMNDGDLLVSIELDNIGNILRARERYECRSMQPITVRGNDKKGRRDRGVPRRVPTGDDDGSSPGAGATPVYTPTGNAYVLNQISAENRLPHGHTAYDVEIEQVAMSKFLKQPHQCLSKIIRDAADIANSERAGVLPPVAKAAGQPFREANNLSSSEYLTMSYDPGILTGLPPIEADRVDIQMRQVAQMALQMSLVQNQDLFVALILAGIKDGVSYVGGL